MHCELSLELAIALYKIHPYFDMFSADSGRALSSSEATSQCCAKLQWDTTRTTVSVTMQARYTLQVWGVTHPTRQTASQCHVFHEILILIKSSDRKFSFCNFHVAELQYTTVCVWYVYFIVCIIFVICIIGNIMTFFTTLSLPGVLCYDFFILTRLIYNCTNWIMNYTTINNCFKENLYTTWTIFTCLFNLYYWYYMPLCHLTCYLITYRFAKLLLPKCG